MNKVNKMIFVFAVTVCAGCCFFAEDARDVLTVLSPDGKNEIRLWTDPLAYEVRRGGEVIVAKSEIGMKVDGKCLVPAAKCLVRKEEKSGFVEMPVYKKDRPFSERDICGFW